MNFHFVVFCKAYETDIILFYIHRLKARHEFITVLPDGFRFRQQTFDGLTSLFKWFKEHFRDPIPGTPVTPRTSTQRTPYMTGNLFEFLVRGRDANSLAIFIPWGFRESRIAFFHSSGIGESRTYSSGSSGNFWGIGSP